MLTRKENYLPLVIATLFSGAAMNASAEWASVAQAPAPPMPADIIKPALPSAQNQNTAINKTVNQAPNKGADKKTITWLGVSLSEVPEVLLQQMGGLLEKGQGVIVKAVQPGSPAEASDVQAFDIITHFEGKAMATPDQLNKLIYQTKPGSKVKIDVIRKGEKKTLAVTLGSRVVTRPQPQAQQQAQERPSFWQRNGMMPFANSNGNGWNMPFNNNNAGGNGWSMPFGGNNNGGNGWSMPFGGNNGGGNGWSMPFGGNNSSGNGWSMPFGGNNNGSNGWSMPFGGNNNGGNGWSMPFGGNNNGSNYYGNNGNMPFNPGSWNMGNNNQNQRLQVRPGPNGLIQVYALVPDNTGKPQSLSFQGTRDGVYQQIMQHQAIADSEKKLLIEALDSRLSNSPMSAMPWGNGGMTNGNFNPFSGR